MDLNTPAPINYETALPQGVGKLVQQDDGSMVLANEHEQGFMVNQAIVDFWKSCNGQRKVTDLGRSICTTNRITKKSS